jgi:hypothetical protein
MSLWERIRPWKPADKCTHDWVVVPGPLPTKRSYGAHESKYFTKWPESSTYADLEIGIAYDHDKLRFYNVICTKCDKFEPRYEEAKKKAIEAHEERQLIEKMAKERGKRYLEMWKKAN